VLVLAVVWYFLGQKKGRHEIACAFEPEDKLKLLEDTKRYKVALLMPQKKTGENRRSRRKMQVCLNGLCQVDSVAV